jgi:polysaccharide export outer membrane protein
MKHAALALALVLSGGMPAGAADLLTPAPAVAPPAPAPAAAAPGSSVAVGANYKIHAGDQLAISVYGEPSLTQAVTVLPDATVEYPMVGRVMLGGLTPSQASTALGHALAKYLRSPIVSVGVVNEGQLTVMILGNVKTPGKYTLPYSSHVTDAVAAAGGMGPTNGDYPVARVSDVNGVRDASLQGILRGGDIASDVMLSNNSVVYIPSPVTFNIEVVGAVDKPGEVSVSQGDRLSAAIAKAGNSANSNADLNAIRVTRDLGNGQTKVMNINLYNQLQHGDTASDIVLQKNDVVYVPQAHKGGSAVTGTIFGILGRVFGF